MGQKISTTWALTISTLKMFVRNKQGLFFTLFMPIIIMAIFGLIGFNQQQKIQVGITSNSGTPAQDNQVITALKKIEVLQTSVGNIDEERNAIDKGERSAVIILPQSLTFSDGLPPVRPGQPDHIEVLVNPGERQQAQAAINILEQFLNQYSLTAVHAQPLFTLDTRDVNSQNLDYFDFLLPGVVALAIMQMSVFSVSFVFVDFKEKGILKRVLATPVKPNQFVTANVITRLLVAIVQATILIAVGVLIFHAQVIGSYLLILLSVILGAIMFLALGFIISGLAKTVEAVPAIANLIVFPMLFLGGTFFPLSSMPDWLEKIVKYLPLTFLSTALREVMTRGANFSAIQRDVYWMAGWAIVLIILANWTFGLEEKNV